MISTNFRFSPAAKLYCQYIDLVDQVRNAVAKDAQDLYQANRTLISEMRAEAYHSILAFGELLLEALSREPWEQQGLQLRKKMTYTTRSYAGQTIHYRWLEPAAHKTTAMLGHIYVFLPIPEKLQALEDDSKFRGTLEPITMGSLKVRIASDAPDASQRTKTTDLARNTNFGTFEEVNEKGSRSNLWIPVNGDDPVASAHTRLTALLRSIYEIDYTR